MMVIVIVLFNYTLLCDHNRLVLGLLRHFFISLIVFLFFIFLQWSSISGSRDQFQIKAGVLIGEHLKLTFCVSAPRDKCILI
jgi:hypothetical protein